MAKRSKKLPAAGGRPTRQVHLVQPPVGGGPTDVTPPLGLLVLGAILEAEGHEVKIADLNLRAKQGRLDSTKALRGQFLRAIPKKPNLVDVIGVTAWSYNFDVTMEFVEAAKKKHPHAPMILGGPHLTFVDREALEAFDSIDYILRGEGDRTFPQLLKVIEAGAEPEALAEIPGLTWRRDGEVVQNASGSVVEDLDALPYPAYHLVDVGEYLAQQPTLVVEAGRGCPYNCNFCSTSNMFQRKYRVKSAARLIDEVEWAMQHTGTNRFELLHDNLVANKKYVLELCAEIRRRNIDLAWSCTSRPDNMTEEVAEAMFLAGCDMVFFGVETLDAERQKWTGKGLKPPMTMAAMELTRRQHITPSLGIIIGFPDETQSEFDATVGAAVRWTTDLRAEVSTAILRYYPGADLFEDKDALRFDPLAATDSAGLPGYSIRPEWRDQRSLFPLQAIHTGPDETKRNLIRRNFIRTLLKACPYTFRGCIERLDLGPRDLLDRLTDGKEFAFLTDRRDRTVLWNEVIGSLGELLREAGSQELIELLSCEVPFWETAAVVDRTATLEHVVKPKRYEQQELLAFATREREEPPGEVEGLSLLAIRAGPEAVVWFTPEPDKLLSTFQESYAADPVGTTAYVNSLQRGL